MRISDWSSDVCSSDLGKHKGKAFLGCDRYPTCTHAVWPDRPARGDGVQKPERLEPLEGDGKPCPKCKKGVMRTRMAGSGRSAGQRFLGRSEEHTSELQSLMRISYAVFCLKKKNKKKKH